MKPDLHIWTQAPSAYTNRRLIEEAQKLGLNATLSSPQNTPPRPRPGSLLLLRSSALDYRDHDIKLAQLWQNRGLLHCTNSLEQTCELRDKLTGALYLTKRKLNVPTTYSLDDTELIEKLYSEHRNGFVVKPRRSNQGKGLFVLDSLESLRSVRQAFIDLGDTRFVVQPRLLKKREWRILGLPARAPLWILRQARNPHQILGNRSYCEESLFESKNNDSLMALELKLQNLLSGLQLWGADVIETVQGELFVIEINPSPGLQGAEQLTGENLTHDLLSSLLRTLPNQI